MFPLTRAFHRPCFEFQREIRGEGRDGGGVEIGNGAFLKLEINGIGKSKFTSEY